jgi:predicted nucleotidyltransferase
MSIDVDVLVETYSTLKQYITPKDRQEAADALISVLVDLLGDSDIKEFASTDNFTKNSFKDYVKDYEDLDPEDEEFNY